MHFFAKHGTALIGLVVWCGLIQAPPTVRIKPHLNNITATGVTFGWETVEPSTGEVTLVSKSSGERVTRAETAAKTVHLLRVEGLRPETEYSYTLQSAGSEFTYSVKTAPAAARPITFIAIGDSRLWGDSVEQTKMIEHMLQWKPEFFLINGDLVQDGHVRDHWLTHFKRFAEILPRYMMIGIRGNHEGTMLSDLENDWFGIYHELPGGDEPYASFTWGNTHLVVLSWEQLELERFRTEVSRWLDTHLAGVSSPWTVVNQHFPIYCTGYYMPNDDRKVPLVEKAWEREILERRGVDLHLSGHTHIYERTYPLRSGKRDDRDGIPYIINGGSIGANHPDWWSAVTDDGGQAMAPPTYSVFECADERITIRSFVHNPARGFQQIDFYIKTRDDSGPARLLAGLARLEGSARIAAVEQLGAMLYGPAIPALVRLLDNREDQDTRRKAAAALRSIGKPESARAIVPFLADRDVEVRRELARALEIAMPAELAAQAAMHAADRRQDAMVRYSLLGALQFHFPTPRARKAALGILADPRAPVKVRERAAHVLGTVAVRDDLPVLARVFSAETQRYVVQRLARNMNVLVGERRVDVDDRGLQYSRPGKYRERYARRWLSAPSAGAAAERAAAPSAEEAAVLEVVETWTRGVNAKDMQAATSVFSDRFRYGAFTRIDGDKAHYLERIAPFIIDGPLKNGRAVSNESGVQIYGAEAVVYELKIRVPEKDHMVDFFLEREGEAWRIVRAMHY